MILLSDGDWQLNEDTGSRGRRSRRLSYWLTHQCDTGHGVCTRYFSIIDDPCVYCGSRCPVPLQGMYNMMVYL